MQRLQSTRAKVSVAIVLLLVWCLSLLATFQMGWRKGVRSHNTSNTANQQEALPNVRIVILDSEKRLKPDRLPGYYFHPTARESDRLPPEQVDNPVVFHYRYAVARFENASNSPLSFYCVSLLWWPLDSELRHALKAQAFEIREQRERDRVLANLEEMATPSMRDIAIVDVDVRGESGEIIRPTTLHRSLIEPRVPMAKDVINKKFPAYVLQPKDSVDLPMPILGHLTNRQSGLKPGTYTVRAVVSYAEAPSGETRRITSEPVTITVTEEHIKAAEAYWASVQK